jgi:HK97 gp10 family phage protein
MFKFDSILEMKDAAKTKRYLKNLDKKIRKKAVRKALRTTANVLKKELTMHVKAKIKSSQKTGTRKLWSNKVKSKPYRQGNKSLTKAGAIKVYTSTHKKVQYAFVSPKQDFFYARILEKGSSKRPLWSPRKNGTRFTMAMPARPVFIPTADQMQDRLDKTFKSTLLSEARSFSKGVR